MPITNRDTPLAATPEPRFTTVQDTVKPKLSPYMQKRAAQDAVKQRNIKARDSILNRNANAQGKTREEVRARQEKDKKKPDVSPYGSSSISLEEARCGHYKETSKKGCGIAKEANRENSKQNFR